MKSGDAQSSAMGHDAEKQDARHVFKHTGIGLAGVVGGKVAQYIYSIVLAKILGPQLLGAYFLATKLAFVISGVSRLAMAQAVIKFVPSYWVLGDARRAKGAVVGALAISTITGLVAALALFLFSKQIASKLFHYEDLSIILRLLSPTIPILSVGVVAIDCTRAFHTLKYSSFVGNVFRPLFKVTIGVWLLLAVGGLAIAAGIHALSILLGAVLSVYSLYRVFPRFGRTRAIVQPGRLLSYSMPLFWSGLTYHLLTDIDSFMLGYFATVDEVGIYGVAINTGMLLTVAVAPVADIFTPLVSSLDALKQKDRLDALFRTVSRWHLMATMPVFIVIILFPGQLMAVFGSGFVKGADALVLLAVAQFFAVPLYPCDHMLRMTGYQNRILYGSVVAVLLNVGLNWIFIPMYGIVGAAAATGLSKLCLWCYLLIEVRLRRGIWPFSRHWLKVLVAGAVVGMAALGAVQWSEGRDPLWVLVIGSACVLAGYSLLVFFFALDSTDRAVLASAYRKLKSIGHMGQSLPKAEERSSE